MNGWFTTTITYQTVRALGVRKGKCAVCGRSGRRQRMFTQTVNPWNKKDGTPKTNSEVSRAVRAEADSWASEPFVHPSCEEGQR